MSYREQLLSYGNIPTLTGWRGVAVLLVIIGHLKFGFPKQSTEYFWMDNLIYANFGVRIFFVLRGFLITTLLVKEKLKFGKINLRNFYIRRILRIVPVLWLYLITVAIISKIFHLDLNYHHFLGPLFYLTNFNIFQGTWLFAHTWSLAVEEQYYLLWPVLFQRIKNLMYWVICILLLTPLIVSITYLKPNLSNYLLHPFFSHGAAIFTGSLLSLVWCQNFYNIKIEKYLRNSVFFVLLVVAWAISILVHNGKMGKILLPGGDLILNIIVSYLITFSILKSTGHISKFLNSSVINKIGILSYSIYIWQQLFIIPYDEYSSWSKYLFFPQNIILVFLVSFISYNFFEKPFLQLKQKFTT